MVSVVGGDVEIGALAAAFANGDSFTVEDPYGAESIVSLGEKPLCFRGSIVVQGRKRPLRLFSCSQELADTTSDGKLLLMSDDRCRLCLRWCGTTACPPRQNGDRG